MYTELQRENEEEKGLSEWRVPFHVFKFPVGCLTRLCHTLYALSITSFSLPVAFSLSKRASGQPSGEEPELGDGSMHRVSDEQPSTSSGDPSSDTASAMVGGEISATPGPAIYFKCPTACKSSSSFATIENHHSPYKFGCSYAPHLFMEDHHEMHE